MEQITAVPNHPRKDKCGREIPEETDPVTVPDSAIRIADLNAPTPLDSVAEALLHRAIQHQALTPDEARDLATWDLRTITEYLALRLHKEGLLTARESRAMLGNTTSGH